MRIALVAAGLLIAALAPAATAAPRPTVVDACAQATPGHARCFAQVRNDVHGGRGVRGPLTATALPNGYGPADLRSAYNLPTTGGTGQTVGIVDAGHDPTVEADLAVYRSTYGLPACTTANGCFREVNQRGATSPLPGDYGWAGEISIDVDMVSAACPSCHVLLVDADTQASGDLAAAVDTAVTLGANEVSNSYGVPESNGMQQFEAHYAHPGVAILAASGDSGYGVPNAPAVYPTVTAVGGTSLTRATNARGWTETAWSGAGSGCSAWVDKPAWQHDPDCPGRMTADVAADADLNTGVALYDSYDHGGWVVGGGTSVASPFVAGIIALAGNPGQFGDASYLYTHANALNDVVSGNNVVTTTCGDDYQCNAVSGYDGPTGNGTPNGLAAF